MHHFRQVTFYVVIPSNSNPTRLKELQTRLNTADMRRLADAAIPTPCLILVPKMRLATGLRLDDELKYLGVNTLFSPSEADLALMTPGKHFTVSDLFPLQSFKSILKK